MDTQTNKTNKFVSIIVSLITNIFFISVKIVVAIFSLVFHLGSKSSSDDKREAIKQKSSTFEDCFKYYDKYDDEKG